MRVIVKKNEFNLDMGKTWIELCSFTQICLQVVWLSLRVKLILGARNVHICMCMYVWQLGWSVPIELLIGSTVSISYQTDRSSSVCCCVFSEHFVWRYNY